MSKPVYCPLCEYRTKGTGMMLHHLRIEHRIQIFKWAPPEFRCVCGFSCCYAPDIFDHLRSVDLKEHITLCALKQLG